MGREVNIGRHTDDMVLVDSRSLDPKKYNREQGFFYLKYAEPNHFIEALKTMRDIAIDRGADVSTLETHCHESCVQIIGYKPRGK